MTHLDRRTLLSGLGALCLSGAAGLGATSSAVAQTVPAAPRRPAPAVRDHGLVTVHAVRTTRPVVALTFDDGPHPTHTPMLLDILAQHRAKATFYVVGQMVRSYPEITRRIVAEGHEIGNHTWRHPFLWNLGDRSVLEEIDRTQQVVWDTVGAVPVTMRPPYAAITARQSSFLQAQRHLPTILWSVDTSDWRRPGSSVVAQRMINGSQPGAIILAHDIHGPTVRAVPEALPGIAARGLGFATISELLGWETWGPRGLRYVSAPDSRFSG